VYLTYIYFSSSVHKDLLADRLDRCAQAGVAGATKE